MEPAQSETGDCRVEPAESILVARLSMSHLVPLLEFNLSNRRICDRKWIFYEADATGSHAGACGVAHSGSGTRMPTHCGSIPSEFCGSFPGYRWDKIHTSPSPVEIDAERPAPSLSTSGSIPSVRKETAAGARAL